MAAQTTGEGIPSVEVAVPRGLTPQPPPPARVREEFDTDTLPIAFQWLRSPWPDELYSLASGRATCVFTVTTIGSLFKQALVARRQQSHCYSGQKS